MHLGVDELSDVVSAVWPLELAKALNLAVLQASPVDEILACVGICIGCPPLLVAFSLHHAPFEVASNLQHAPVYLFYSLAPHFVLVPGAFVFNLQVGLAVLALAMEQPVSELSVVATPVLKSLFALSIWKVRREVAGNDASVSIVERALALLDTVAPLAPVDSAVQPPAGAEAAHFALQPLSGVAPASLLANEHALPSLEPLRVLSLENVSVSPLPDP